MSNKLTKKQEDFAQKYVDCGVAARAYRQVYDVSKMTDKSVHELACRVLAKDKVQSRVNQLKQEVLESVKTVRLVTIEEVTEILKSALEIAVEKMNEDSIRKIAMDLAKLHGLIVEKSDINVNDQSRQVSESQVQVAMRFMRREQKKLKNEQRGDVTIC